MFAKIKYFYSEKKKHNVAKSHFIRCVLEYIANQFLDGKQGEDAQKAFRAIDASGQGYLHAENIKNFFNSADLSLEEAMNIIRSLDKQKNGYITFSEFK